jgi:uncharacterized ferredoxin-like protein
LKAKKQKRKVLKTTANDIPKDEAITTIEDILTEDNVRDAFARMVEELPNITDMVCVYRDREGSINWKCTSESTIERIVSMIEIAKFGILAPEEGDDE